MVAKMTDAQDRKIHIGANGQQYIFDLSECTEVELENFKTLLMWTLQTLIGQRNLLYEAIAKVNGEMDRRINESTPGTPASGGHGK